MGLSATAISDLYIAVYESEGVRRRHSTGRFLT